MPYICKWLHTDSESYLKKNYLHCPGVLKEKTGLSSPLESLFHLGELPLFYLGQLGLPLVLLSGLLFFLLDPPDPVKHRPQFARAPELFHTFEVADDRGVADHDEWVMGDRDRQSVKDRPKDGKILSTVDRDHGGLSLLAVQGCEDIQKRVRGLLGTIAVSSSS
jgi:hypothetical protein